MAHRYMFGCLISTAILGYMGMIVAFFMQRNIWVQVWNHRSAAMNITAYVTLEEPCVMCSSSGFPNLGQGGPGDWRCQNYSWSVTALAQYPARQKCETILVNVTTNLMACGNSEDKVLNLAQNSWPIGFYKDIFYERGDPKLWVDDLPGVNAYFTAVAVIFFIMIALLISGIVFCIKALRDERATENFRSDLEDL